MCVSFFDPNTPLRVHVNTAPARALSSFQKAFLSITLSLSLSFFLFFHQPSRFYKLQWPNWGMWWLHQVNTLETGLNRNFEVWTSFSTQTHAIKQMEWSVIHFEKLQLSSITTLPQLWAGLATKVYQTFCLFLLIFLLLCTADFDHSSSCSEMLFFITRSGHTVQAGEPQTQFLRRRKPAFFWGGRGQKDCSDR